MNEQQLLAWVRQERERMRHEYLSLSDATARLAYVQMVGREIAVKPSAVLTFLMDDSPLDIHSPQTEKGGG